MREKKSIVLIFLIIVSIFIQVYFISYLVKISSMNKFIFIRDTIKRSSKLGKDILTSYKNFEKSDSCSIIEIPSSSKTYMISRSKSDYLVAVYKNKILTLSMYPSDMSFRERKTMYVKGVSSMYFNSIDEVHYFICTINNNNFLQNFYINPHLSRLPVSRDVFR